MNIIYVYEYVNHFPFHYNLITCARYIIFIYLLSQKLKYEQSFSLFKYNLFIYLKGQNDFLEQLYQHTTCTVFMNGCSEFLLTELSGMVMVLMRNINK